MSVFSSFRLTSFVSFMTVMALLGGCKNMPNMSDVTGSIGMGNSTTLPTNDADLRAFSEEWGKKFEANPSDKTTALTYANSLKALTLYNQEAAVLQSASMRHADDKELLAAYGKALADCGRFDEAIPVLENAHTPERPNWSIYSTEGTIADQKGDHRRAQAFYVEALKIMPNEPRVLSNLGLSYALSHDMARAEQVSRQAAADPRADMRVRQNLALVLAMEGKYDEALQVAEKDLPPDQARASIASMKSMSNQQSNSWSDIQKLDNPKSNNASPKPTNKKS